MPKDAQQLIAWANFQAPGDVPWDTDAKGGQLQVEFADLAGTSTTRTTWRRVTCRC